MTFAKIRRTNLAAGLLLNTKAVRSHSTLFTKQTFYAKIFFMASFAVRYTVASANYISTAANKILVRFKPKDNTINYYFSDYSFFGVQPLFYFLRKHKLFNKGRYSRNRQTYRTGAYWCFWVNILAVTGFYYWFYRFSMNLGYLWPFFSLFVISFIFPRALKYNYLFFTNLAASIIKLFTWFYTIFFGGFHVSLSFIEDFRIFCKSQFSFVVLSGSQTFIVSILNFLLTVCVTLFSYFSFFICDRFDLYIKKYSYWNYFLPLRWIHRDHRSFFYYRVLHIVVGTRLQS